MDRYDALLEHLKLTQRHGLDAVANRLNDFVIQLENLVDTMKTSVQDALPADADELFPITEIESELAGLSVTAQSEPGPSTGVSLDNLRLLEGAKSQSELLRALLPLLGEHVGRAVVLVIRDGVVTAWLAVSDVTTANGAMSFVPGSHHQGQLEHHDTFRDDNLGFRVALSSTE